MLLKASKLFHTQVHESNMAHSSDNRVALLNEVTKRNAPSKSGAASMAANLVGEVLFYDFCCFIDVYEATKRNAPSKSKQRAWQQTWWVECSHAVLFMNKVKRDAPSKSGAGSMAANLVGGVLSCVFLFFYFLAPETAAPRAKSNHNSPVSLDLFYTHRVLPTLWRLSTRPLKLQPH